MEPRKLTDEELEFIRNADAGAIGHKTRLLEHIQAQAKRIEALEAERQQVQDGLPMLVKIAAREQRYLCVDAYNGTRITQDATGVIQNAPCPDIEDVLKKWHASPPIAAGGEKE